MIETTVTIGAIENAIIAHLRAAEAALGYRWWKLESYPDDWEAYLAADSEIRGPSAWVTFAGWDSARKGDNGNVLISGALFGVTVCGQSKRNERATRQGGTTTAEVGSYQLAQDVVLLLSGEDLGLDINFLRPGRGQLVAMPANQRAKGLSFFAMPFATDFELERVEAEFPAFSVIHANWDIPPFGQGSAGPIGTIPDDAHADATDIISLEQPDP